MHTFIATTAPKFPLGQTVATPGVIALLKTAIDHLALADAFARHVTGDWGDMPPEDCKANDESLIDGSRLMSAYTVGGEKIWIITEADRSVTTALLPDEY